MPDIAPFIALASGLGTVVVGRGAWRRRTVNHWPTARARVGHTEVEVSQDAHRPAERDDHPRRFLARVHYRFEVDGRRYHSDNGRFDAAPAFPSREAAEAFLARTPPGTVLTIRHAPDTPELTQVGGRRLPIARLGLTAFLAGLCAMALWLALP